MMEIKDSKCSVSYTFPPFLSNQTPLKENKN